MTSCGGPISPVAFVLHSSKNACLVGRLADNSAQRASTIGNRIIGVRRMTTERESERERERERERVRSHNQQLVGTVCSVWDVTYSGNMR